MSDTSVLVAPTAGGARVGGAAAAAVRRDRAAHGHGSPSCTASPTDGSGTPGRWRAGTASTTSTSRSSTGRPSTRSAAGTRSSTRPSTTGGASRRSSPRPGMLTDEYENGYDWFHQGESLIFFYALCAADPDDAEFRERARRFAELYLDPGERQLRPGRERHPGPAQRRARRTARASATSGSRTPPSQTEHEAVRPAAPGDPRHRRVGRPGGSGQGRPHGRRDAPPRARRRRGQPRRDEPRRQPLAVRRRPDGRPTGSCAMSTDGGSARRANGGLLPDNVGPDGVVGSLQDGKLVRRPLRLDLAARPALRRHGRR